MFMMGPRNNNFDAMESSSVTPGQITPRAAHAPQITKDVFALNLPKIRSPNIAA